MKVDNESVPGSSNLMITKAIVDYSKYTKDTVVVVMWSNNDRETIYNDHARQKLHMLPGFLDDHMPRTFWFNKDKNNFKKKVITYYEDYHEDWNATLNQMIRMNFVYAFLKNKGIKSFHVQSRQHATDSNYFDKFLLKNLDFKYFNYKKEFFIDDALDIPKPHPGPRSHALMATNIQHWFFK